MTDLYHTQKADLPLLVSKMTAEPAGIFGIDAGTLTIGKAADITILDPEQEWTVEEKNFYTKGTHSPFAGRHLKGKAVLTMVDGRIVMKDGKVIC